MLSVMRKGELIIMSLSKVGYSLNQAKKNVIRNGLMTVASLFTISSCLIILGLFTILTMNVNYITAQVKDQCEVQLFLDAQVSEERITSVKAEIDNIENVKESVLFTKEDMLAFAKEDMFEGKEDLLTGFEGEDNPFSNSYKITLENIEKTSETVSRLAELDGVDHVENKQDVVNTVVSVSNIIKRMSLAIMALLLVIAIVIISNTVKLTVFNRRKEITIMKYIGATDRFIRIPFVMEGMLIGLIGAVISFCLMSWGYTALLGYIAAYKFDMFEFLSYITVAPIIGLLFLLVGCLIGIAGSLFSMRKYLKA